MRTDSVRSKAANPTMRLDVALKFYSVTDRTAKDRSAIAFDLLTAKLIRLRARHLERIAPH